MSWIVTRFFGTAFVLSTSGVGLGLWIDERCTSLFALSPGGDWIATCAVGGTASVVDFDEGAATLGATRLPGPSFFGGCFNGGAAVGGAGDATGGDPTGVWGFDDAPFPAPPTSTGLTKATGHVAVALPRKETTYVTQAARVISIETFKQHDASPEGKVVVGDRAE